MNVWNRVHCTRNLFGDFQHLHSLLSSSKVFMMPHWTVTVKITITNVICIILRMNALHLTSILLWFSFFSVPKNRLHKFNDEISQPWIDQYSFWIFKLNCLHKFRQIECFSSSWIQLTSPLRILIETEGSEYFSIWYRLRFWSWI